MFGADMLQLQRLASHSLTVINEQIRDIPLDRELSKVEYESNGSEALPLPQLTDSL